MRTGSWLAAASGLLSSLPVQAALFVDGFESTPAFAVEAPTVEVAAGGVETRCYFFRAPDTAQALRRIASTMGPGVEHLVVYATYDDSWQPLEVQPPGTLGESCPLSSGRSGWLHVAHDAFAETVLPASDGADRRLAFVLAPGQPLVLQLRLLNAADVPIQVQADLVFESWAPGLEVVNSASHAMFDGSLSIPPGAAGHVASRTCALPPGSKTWRATMRTHKQGTRMRLLDGASVLLDGNDWQHPPVATFAAPAFHAFAAGATAECTYANNTNRTITAGDDEDTDETCLALAWFFPATRPTLCFNGLGPL